MPSAGSVPTSSNRSVIRHEEFIKNIDKMTGEEITNSIEKGLVQ